VYCLLQILALPRPQFSAVIVARVGCGLLQVESRVCYWPIGSEVSRIRGLNRSPAVVSRTRPPGVRWNSWEEINCFSDFTSQILPWLRPCPFCLILPVGFYQDWKLVRFCLSGLFDFTKAENSSDFTRAENWAEGVSDFEVWDIGQVTVSNFDWLSFTPLWSPSPVLHYSFIILSRIHKGPGY
jgi:hypothetical protein